MELSKALLGKARNAENVDALQAMARENGWNMTREEAKAYFDQMHKSGALSDEELENVTGGGCRKNDHLVVTIRDSCPLWKCKNHPWAGATTWVGQPGGGKQRLACPCGRENICGNCHFCHYEGGLWLCYNPEK